MASIFPILNADCFCYSPIMKRIIWLDAIKGAGIILVILSHTSLIPRYGEILTAGYMALFYISAGYTYKEPESLHALLEKKARRLLLPYCFYGILSIILAMAVSAIISDSYDFLSGVKGLLYSRYSLYAPPRDTNVFLLKNTFNTPLWFLTSLFTSYITFFFLSKCRHTIIAIGGYIAISIAAYFMPILLPWSVDVAFIGGILMWYGNKHRAPTENYRVFLLYLALYCILIAFDGKNNLSIRQYGAFGMWSIFSYLLIGILEFNILSFCFKKIEKSDFCDALARVGRMSLILMVLHAPVFLFLRKMAMAANLFSDSSTMQNIICAIMSFAIIITFAKFVGRTHNNKIRLIFGL